MHLVRVIATGKPNLHPAPPDACHAQLLGPRVIHLVRGISYGGLSLALHGSSEQLDQLT